MIKGHSTWEAKNDNFAVQSLWGNVYTNIEFED